MNCKKLLVSLTACAAVSLSAYSANRTWKVGKSGDVDFDEIQKVFTCDSPVVQNGDRIEVGPGVYQPIVVPRNISCLEIVATAWKTNADKNISVHDQTVIDGGGTNRCFMSLIRKFSSQVESSDNVVLRGFTLRNGYADAVEKSGGGSYGGFVDCCVITNCSAQFGGGAAFSIVRNSRILSCRATNLGGGAMLSRVTGCWIENCDAGSAGGAYVYDPKDKDIEDRTFAYVYSSVVINNMTNGVRTAAANISPSGWMGHVITRADETGTVFLQDTGYDIRALDYAGRINSWHTLREMKNEAIACFGDTDINGRPRLAGWAIDIGPEEFPDNSVSMRQNFVTMGNGAGRFTVDVGAPGLTDKTSDWEWQISSSEPCDWISDLPCAGVGSTTNSLEFSVSANTGKVTRTATLEIRNKDGIPLSPRKLTVTQLATGVVRTNGYALCFGPGSYALNPNTGGPWCGEQSGMANDARVFSQRLVINGLCDQSNVLCYTGKDATHANFMAGLGKIAQFVQPGEVVYVFVSTHGGSAMDPYEYVFSCHGYAEYVYDSELCQEFRKLTDRGAKVVMVIDTCRSSGAYRSPVDVTTRPRNSYYDSNMYAEDGNVAFITAVDYFEDSLGNGMYEDGLAGGKFISAFAREWRKLSARTTDTECGSFLDVVRAVIGSSEYSGTGYPVLANTRDVQWFNEKLLSTLAVSGPARTASVKVGEECNLELTADLGVRINADYLAGDRVDVKLETLPSGLRLVKEPVYGMQGAKKVMIGCRYWVRGTPKEEMAYLRTPMFARITVTRGREKTESLQRVRLDVIDSVNLILMLGGNYYGPTARVRGQPVRVGGLPAGMKFTDKTFYTVNADGSITTNDAYDIYGTPIRAGRSTVKFTYLKDDDKGGKVQSVVSETWLVTAGNPGISVADIGWQDGKTVYQVSDAQAVVLQGSQLSIPIDLSNLVTTGRNAARVTITGLPSGLTYDAKTGQITGTVKTAGKKVVTVKVVQDGETVTTRFAIDIVENPFAGTYYAFFLNEPSGYHTATAVITPSAGGSAKLVLDEYVPSKSKTVKYTVSTATGYGMDTAYDPASPGAYSVSYVFNLKADGRNNPDFASAPRTLRVTFSPAEYGGQKYSVGVADLDNTGFSAPVDKAMSAKEYTALVEGGHLNPAAPMICGNCAVRNGGVFFNFGRFTSIFDAGRTQYAVKGKLADGTTFSVFSPLTWNVPGGDAGIRSAPFFVIEKKGDKRAYVAMQNQKETELFNGDGRPTVSNFFHAWQDTAFTTAARHIGAGDCILDIDTDCWNAGGLAGEAPMFPVKVVGEDPDKAKLEIYAPDAPLGAKPLKTISPYRLTANSAYVFKGSFRWDLAKGGDGATYSFEYVPVECPLRDGSVICFIGQCDVKPPRGNAVPCTSAIVVP